jgi:hypothetical protein
MHIMIPFDTSGKSGAGFHHPKTDSVKTHLAAGALDGVGVEPLSAPEQGAKRQGNLPVLIPLRAGRKRVRIAQDVAPVLDQFRPAVEERLFQRQFTSSRRHGGTHPTLSDHRVMPVIRLICIQTSLSRWSILIVRRDLSKLVSASFRCSSEFEPTCAKPPCPALACASAWILRHPIISVMPDDAPFAPRVAGQYRSLFVIAKKETVPAQG